MNPIENLQAVLKSAIINALEEAREQKLLN
jgi:hypothetical protein